MRSIRFPMSRVRVPHAKPARYWQQIDTDRLTGAAKCIAGMLNCALRDRDEQPRSTAPAAERALRRRIARLGMRAHALWARVFAGQLDAGDPRIAAALDERHQLIRQLAGWAVGGAA